MILGPLPYDGYTLTLSGTLGKDGSPGIEGFSILSFNYTSGDVDMIDYTRASAETQTLSVEIAGQVPRARIMAMRGNPSHCPAPTPS